MRSDRERRERLDRAMFECGFVAENGRDLDSEAIALRFLDDERQDAAREGRPVSRGIREAVLGTAVMRTSARSEEPVERR